MALLARASGNSFQLTNNCFYKSSLNWMKAKLNKRCPSSLAGFKRSSTNSRVVNTGPPSSNEKKKKYVIFDDAMSRRQDQARRSILVQVQSHHSSYELYNYCSQFGKVQEMHHYTMNSSVHFVLIEFKTLADINSINSISTHTNMQQYLPVTSPMLWFRAVPNDNKKGSGSFSKDIPMTVTNGKDFPNSQKINDFLFQAKSISEQMTILYDATKLNDTDTRLRFLTARQIETCLSGMFSDISVLPFGSSVNGFGKHGCDLDLVLKLHTDTEEITKSRLVYHAKARDSNEKAEAQRVMEAISAIMQQFLPGITSIRKILRARVPIIKYNQTLTGLECDLSIKTAGLYMSELLYLYGEIDWRVRPLTFSIRMWAHCSNLTHNTPGGWITNFSLTLLVLFYLQQKQILPSLQQLIKLAKKNDVRIADYCVDCTFLRDISRLPKSTEHNQDTLEELLAQFFIYYSSFDFSTKAVSLNAGIPLPKPVESNVFIYNPFEQHLNVAKNMNVQEMEKFKIEIRNAAWLMDSAAENKCAEWGLLSLFQQRLHRTASNSLQQQRILELSTLFREPSTVDTETLTGGKDTVNTSNSAGTITQNNGSSVGKNADRQGARSAKNRISRKQEWRR